MKLKIIAFLLFAMGAFSACEDDPDVPMPPQPKPAPEMGMRTMLVYIAGDNSLSGGFSDFASLDLEEMIVGAELADTQQNNLIVYMDRRNANPQLIRICHNSENKVVLDTLQSYPARNSVGVSEMKEVFSKVYTDFPAEHYGLSLWSHGEGWVPSERTNTRWIGQDKTNYMNIKELCQVLEVAPHLDFILFDACFMQSVEVAYELRGYADYFIGSPTEIPGPGAPYNTLVPSLFGKEDVATEIGNSYFDYYDELYIKDVLPTNEKWTGGVSVSIIKSEALSALAFATKNIISKYVSNKQLIDLSVAMCYDRRTITRYYHDFDGLVRFLTDGNADYKVWKIAFDAVVVQWNTTPMNYSAFASMFSMDGSAGLSTYIPRKNSWLNNYYHSYEWYTAAGWNSTGW